MHSIFQLGQQGVSQLLAQFFRAACAIGSIRRWCGCWSPGGWCCRAAGGACQGGFPGFQPQFARQLHVGRQRVLCAGAFKVGERIAGPVVATEAETITIKGAGSVNLSGVTTIGVVTKVDATASTGNVTIDLSTHAKSVAYFGSEGVDTYKASTLGDNIYTGKGADQVTLTAGVRDTFVLKAATDSQIGDTDKSGKITLAGDEAKGGVQMIDTITTFEAGGIATTDRLDVTNYAFAGAQRGVVDVTAIVTNATNLTSIADLFAAPAGDRGLAVSLIGTDTYVFIDANKDGNFTAADDSIIKLVGVAALGETDINF